MADTELQLLPLGTSDFSTLRQRSQIYVDKTALIYELASKPEKFFLARPRRFGKSLLVSTFESLFKYGLKDFKGLAIEKLWKEETTYQVVRLDFSEVKNFSSAEQFQTILDRYFWQLMQINHYESPIQTGSEGLQAFKAWLAVQKQNSVVLLIDEYDAPLTACLNKVELFESVRMTLAELYATIKRNDRILRFFFMTGITKFNKTGIFSELNNLTDISLDSEFGSLLGYTQKELELYFGAYLNRAAEVLNLSKENLVSELTKYYDGFCFSEDASKHVFVPWSTLNFLQSPRRGFRNYWYESGGQPRVLLEYIKSHSIKEPAEYEREKKVRISALSGSANPDTISDLVLLTQAGYLTIKAVKDMNVTLGYPNVEVALSMGHLYAEIMLNEDAMERTGDGLLGDYLRAGKAKQFVEEVNRIILGVDHTRYPLTNEAACRGAVHLMLTCSQLTPIPEVHNALGESDLEVDAGDYHWVLEFKFVGAKDSAEGLCKKGVEQVKTHKYGEQFERKYLRRLVLVFAQEAKQFVCWSEVN